MKRIQELVDGDGDRISGWNLKNLQRRVYYRDEEQCQFCKKELTYSQNSAGSLIPSLHIHHIDRNRKNNDESNLICLCASCHMKIHAYEDNVRKIKNNPKF